MARLASDPSLRESLGRAGRKAFQEQWSEPPVLARYFELIRRLAHERGMQQILDRVENEAQPASLSE